MKKLILVALVGYEVCQPDITRLVEVDSLEEASKKKQKIIEECGSCRPDIFFVVETVDGVATRKYTNSKWFTMDGKEEL